MVHEKDNKIDYSEFMYETGIDEDTLKELYEVFLEEILQEKEMLLVRFSQKDFIKLGRTVHNLKGISGSYKAQQIFECAQIVDTEIKADKHDKIDLILVELVKAIDVAAQDIRYHFKIQ